MKKVVLMAMLVVLVTSSYVFAWRGDCSCYFKKETDINSVKMFQKDSYQLRDELMIKKFELKNEYAKEPKDVSRIEALRKEILELRNKINSIAEKYNVFWGNRGRGGCGKCCNDLRW